MSWKLKPLLISCFLVIAATVSGSIWWFQSRPPQPEPAPGQSGSDDNQYVLDPKKQVVIWEGEHITFELETLFGKALLKAIRARDRTAIQAFLLPDFQGTVLSFQGGAKRHKAPLAETRWDADSTSTETANPKKLADALLANVSRYKRIDRQMMRVLAIEQLPTQHRWKARVLLGFTGIDHDDQFLLLESEHWIECHIEDEMVIDRVPLIDRWTMIYEVLRTSPVTLMEDATESHGLADLPIPDNWDLKPMLAQQNRFQLAVADFNQDGYLDIAIAVVAQKPILLQSIDGRSFRDVSQQLGLKDVELRMNLNYVAGWIDYDNDGYPDLILNDRLYHNSGGKKFEEVTYESGLYFHPECMGCTVVDYDCDGLLDLYLLYQRPHDGLTKKQTWVDDHETGKPNELWRNEGNGRFRNVTAESNAGGGKGHTQSATWFFHDEDHFPDLFIANDFGKNVLLRNRGDGTFEDISNQSGATGYATTMGVTSGDTNNDGLSDLYLGCMFSKMGKRIIGQVCEEDYPPGIFDQIKGSCAGNQLFVRKSADKKYADYSHHYGVNNVGWAYAPVMFDLDNDGWLDLYATAGFMSFARGEPDG
jgi:hypothetical protein